MLSNGKCAKIEQCEWSNEPFAWTYTSTSDTVSELNEKILSNGRMVSPSINTHMSATKLTNAYIDDYISTIERDIELKSSADQSNNTATTTQAVPVIFTSLSASTPSLPPLPPTPVTINAQMPSVSSGGNALKS